MFQLMGGGDKAGSGMDKIRAGWRAQHWRSPRLEESLQLIPCDTDLMHEIHSHWSSLQYVALEKKENIYEFIESKRVTV